MAHSRKRVFASPTSRASAMKNEILWRHRQDKNGRDMSLIRIKDGSMPINAHMIHLRKPGEFPQIFILEIPVAGTKINHNLRIQYNEQGENGIITAGPYTVTTSLNDGSIKTIRRSESKKNVPNIKPKNGEDDLLFSLIKAVSRNHRAF